MTNNVLQDILTEGDTGKPFFSDRGGSEEPKPTCADLEAELDDVGLTALYAQEGLAVWRERYEGAAGRIENLRLRVVRADMLGHVTLPLETIRSIFAWD